MRLQTEKTHHKIIFGDARKMGEIKDESIHLVVTSPPYPMIEMWDNDFIKSDSKIRKLFSSLSNTQEPERKEEKVTTIFNAMHHYLAPIWKELSRVLVKGGIACINIGDATRKMNGVFRIFTNHAKLIQMFEEIGFVSLPYILWKKPTNRPNAFLGSGFLPTNAYVTLDVEYILIFRKGGPRQFFPKDPNRYNSKFTKQQRDKWFSQVWEIKGTKQNWGVYEQRTAAFPEEIPYRLIRMFSVKGDTVLDPFLGTGTVTKVAHELERNSIGYEINAELKHVIMEKVCSHQTRLFDKNISIEFVERKDF